MKFFTQMAYSIVLVSVAIGSIFAITYFVGNPLGLDGNSLMIIVGLPLIAAFMWGMLMGDRPEKRDS
ncbi:MAG: hypothetical protein AAGC77_05645 [Pseudomonadota bacterium]